MGFSALSECRRRLDPLNAIIELNLKVLSDFFEAREVVRGRVGPPVVIRMDGVRFGKKLAGRFTEPRDLRVHSALVKAARELMSKFNSDFAYVVSDEVNVFHLSYLPYGGRLSKLLSVYPSLISSEVTLALGLPLQFDARVITFERPQEALAYYLFRVRIGFNNFVSKTYTKLFGPKREVPSLKDMLTSLSKAGHSSEGWELYGTCLFRVEYVKESINPLSGSSVKALRRRITPSSDLVRCINALRLLPGLLQPLPVSEEDL